MSIRPLLAALALCFASSSSPSAESEDFNPYKNAKVGDFATYKISTKVGANTTTGSTTQMVVAKTDKDATIRVVMSVNGMETPPNIQTVDLTKPYDPTKGSLPQGVEAKVEKLKEGKEKVKLGAKEYDSSWTTYKVTAKVNGMDFDTNCKVWMSKDVSLGVVKIEMSGEIGSTNMVMSMEVADTGNRKP